jgi:hypothetical protein
MLVSDGDNLPVICPDLIEICNALEERRTICHEQRGTAFSKRENGDRLTLTGENVNPFMAVLKRQVNPGMPGNTSSSCETDPFRPLTVTAVAPAGIDFPRLRMGPGKMMPRVVWRELLVSRLPFPGARLAGCLHGEELFSELLLSLRAQLPGIFHKPPGTARSPWISGALLKEKRLT